jgi:hypothetical protein
MCELVEEAMTEHYKFQDEQELADWNKLVTTYPLATADALKKLFIGHPDVGDLTGDFECFAHLPPVRIKSQLVFPVVTFAYNWPRQVLRLRVGLFYRFIEEDGRSGLRALGMRFEPPECWDTDDDGRAADPEEEGGHHDMFHAQPIRGLRRDDPAFDLPGMEGVNPTQPSIPLSATDLTGLTVAMLVSIYGRRRVRERYGAQKLVTLKDAAVQVSGFPNPPAKP